MSTTPAETPTDALARSRATDAYKVGVAEATINSLLTRRDLSPGARETVEIAASLIGVDDPTEDGADSYRQGAEVPEPRMDEPQERFATVVAKVVAQHPLDVFIRTHYGNWRRCLDDGEIGSGFYKWSELINPRPTTPTERATGIVGGEDQ